MISVEEVSIEKALDVHATVTEFDELFDKTVFNNRCSGKNNLVIVAYVDGRPAGYLIAYDRFYDCSVYCWMAGVNPDFRGKGVLKVLMGYLDGWAKKEGYEKIRVKTRNKWKVMLFFLIKYGFSFTDVQKKGNIEDYRILLEKSL